MKLKSTEYVPRFRVLFTVEEASLLMAASQKHYDGECRQASECGGIIYGIRNTVPYKVAAILRWRDIDLLCKVLENEPGQFAMDLFVALQKVLQTTGSLLDGEKIAETIHLLETLSGFFTRSFTAAMAAGQPDQAVPFTTMSESCQRTAAKLRGEA